MKTKLIDHLKNDIYCRIGISKVHGVGILAIKDIPKDTNPFKNLSNEKEKSIELNDNELKNVDIETKKIVNDFFGSKQDGQNVYDVLYAGPNYINISYYLNHSDNPNLDIVEKGGAYVDFKTNRDIKKGEELFINYSDYE